MLTEYQTQIRYGELVPPVDLPTSLVDIADIRAFFGIQDTPERTLDLDQRLLMAADIVSAVIRSYTGRYLSKGVYTETFTEVIDQKSDRYLIETPISSVTTDYVTVLNRMTGRVNLMAGPTREVVYEGGYQTMPADLFGVMMELIRQQMMLWGFESIGTTTPANTPQEKAVTIGTLRVEYAVAATSTMIKAGAGGALTAEGLSPYAIVLDTYRSHRRLAGT